MQPLLICLIGAECTGKTSLAQALASQVGGLWVPEYLRAFCEQRGRTPQRQEQLHILQEQLRLEDAAMATAREHKHSLVFCDTAPLLTAIYSEQVFGDDSLYPQARALHARYALTLHLQPDIQWVADGVQRDGADARQRVHALIERELVACDFPFVRISGSAEQRLAVACDAVACATR